MTSEGFLISPMLAVTVFIWGALESFNFPSLEVWVDFTAQFAGSVPSSFFSCLFRRKRKKSKIMSCSGMTQQPLSLLWGRKVRHNNKGKFGIFMAVSL